MLEGVVKRGTGRQIHTLGKPLAGKTGTTNDNRDAWFVGFSPDLAVGVYVGYDDNRSLGTNETGGRVAAPIFRAFMKSALESTMPPPFRIPPAVSLVRINAKTGKLAKPVDETVILEAFKIGTEPSRNSKQAVVRARAHRKPGAARARQWARARAGFTSRPDPRIFRAIFTERTLRAEITDFVDRIKQSIELLRRHL